MRKLISLSFCLLASLSAFAGTPEADQRIYEGFRKYLSQLPSTRHVREYENFFEKYPDNSYLPTLAEEYKQLTGRYPKGYEPKTEVAPSYEPSPTVEAPETTQEPPADISAQEGDPAAEAADVLGVDPAASVVVQQAVETPRAAFERKANTLGLGTDLNIGVLVGAPSLIVDYFVTPKISVALALRSPTSQLQEVALEPRYFLRPEQTNSLYAGLSLGKLDGDFQNLLEILGTNAGNVGNTGSKFAVLAGYQVLSGKHSAYYGELSYQTISISGLRGSASSPSLNIGYRFFFGR